MSRILARIIFVFAHVITCPFGRKRKLKALYRAHSILLQRKFFISDMRRGRLQFGSEIGVRFSQLDRSEPDTIEWLDNFPDEPVVFWDIGANVGVYSLYAALRPDVQVLAFEPGAASYHALNRNIEMNGLDDRITALPVALCADTKIDMLNMDSTEPGGSKHGFGVKIDQLNNVIDIKFHQGAIGFSVDDFVRLFSPPLPTHLKIDVDGLEPDILRGGRKTLLAPTVRSVIIEVEGGEARSRELAALMAGAGFVPRSRPEGSPTCRNVVFDKLREGA